jgi:signal transduction histidine kinase
MAGPTFFGPVRLYNGQVINAASKHQALPVIRRWRAVLYSAAVGIRALVVISVVVLLGAPIGIALSGPVRGTGTAAGLVAAGLALLGVGLPLISVVLARADWSGATALLDRSAGGPPGVRLREPRTLIRPLAYTVIMLTIGGAIAVLALLIIVVSAVALISPLLIAMDDQAVIVLGPFTVSTVPQSVLAAVIAAGVLTGLVLALPALSRAHASLVLQVLTRPEQRLQRDLTVTAQSRARLVRAFDIERRRIERDLHDGVQPQLMSVSMTLGLALAAMPNDAPGRIDVARAQDQAKQTLEDLRNFVRNIHPQVLTDHGLGAAIRELADTLTLPIAVDDRLMDRLPTEIETNLYFCVAELLTNVVKHSDAEHAQVRLHRLAPDVVEVSVRDDGGGGAGATHQDNGGLDGIGDRIAALNGDLDIDSPLGGPTAITITITLTAVGEGHADD